MEEIVRLPLDVVCLWQQLSVETRVEEGATVA
jgi:hypothetical protein